MTVIDYRAQRTWKGANTYTITMNNGDRYEIVGYNRNEFIDQWRTAVRDLRGTIITLEHIVRDDFVVRTFRVTINLTAVASVTGTEVARDKPEESNPIIDAYMNLNR